MLHIQPVNEKRLESSPPSHIRNALRMSSITPRPQENQCHEEPFSFLPFTLAYSVLQYAALLASPVVLPLARWLHPSSSGRLSRMIDHHWDSLPALTQTILYECNYRNPLLESLPTSQRSHAFPPPPTPILSTRRLIPDPKLQPVKQNIDGDQVATVFGWPSSGGVWAKETSLAELSLLGVSATSPAIQNLELKPAIHPSDEDGFCHQLCKLGARFYPSITHYRLSLIPRLGYDEADLEALGP